MTRGGVRTVLFVGLGTAIVPLDSAVNIAFPDITRAFALPLPAIQWVVICYVLTYASLMLGFGRLGDIFGHRRIFLLGLVCGAVGLLLCAVAPSFGWFLAFRVVQGIGAALTLSCGPALITLGFPEAQRGRLLAAYTVMFGLAAGAGPLIGGVLVDQWGWPAVYWFRLPIVAAALLLLRGGAAMPAPAERQPVDLIGTGLLAATLSAFLLALNRGDDAIGLLVVAMIGLFAFLWQERRVAAPIIDLSLFRRAGFALVNVTGVLVQMAGFVVWLLAPYYFLHVLSLTAGLGGVLLAISPFGMVAGGYLGGRAMRSFAPARICAVGAVLMGLGLLAMATWTTGTMMTMLAAMLFLHGFGQGLFQVANLDIVVAAAPRAQRGVAGSLPMVTRTVGFVTSATVGALTFDALRQRALAEGADAVTGFLAGFQVTFLCAGLVALACALGLWFVRASSIEPTVN